MKQIAYLFCMAATVLCSCQSIEPFSIDYILPAEVSFPTELKRVAVVNNMPAVPDNKLLISEEDKKKSENELARLANYYNGDAGIATEALAEALAEKEYFDEVVICDSALRANDINPREGGLTQEEVNELTRGLNVDCLIALENIQMRTIRKVSFLQDISAYYGTVDAKIFPTVRIYLPERKGPMVTINCNDSIFWETYGGSESYVRSHLIDEEEVIRQASQFGGSIPVGHLLPNWKRADRYFYTGGSVNMRDAAVYAKEGDWAQAVQLWKPVYDTKKGKQRMRAAHNLAVGYEMQDSIETAYHYALEAQQLARQIDKVEEKAQNGQVEAEDVPNYVISTIYASDLEQRKNGLSLLNIQMQRLDDDF